MPPAARGFPSARCCDQQVVVIAALPRELDELEKTLLKGMRSELDRAEDDPRTTVGATGPTQLFVEPRVFVRDEIAVRPIAREHRGELREDVGIACR